MKKRILGVLLCVALLAGVLPAMTVSAVEPRFWVNGEQFSDSHKTITCGSGKATFSESTDAYTITLDNATITKGHYNCGIYAYFGGSGYADKPVVLILKGKNTISLPKKDYLSDSGVHGVRSDAELIIKTNGKDAGSLDVSLDQAEAGKTEDCLNCNQTLTIKDVTINYTLLTPDSNDNFFSGKDFLIDNATVKISGARIAQSTEYVRFAPSAKDYLIMVGTEDDGKPVRETADRILRGTDTSYNSYYSITPRKGTAYGVWVNGEQFTSENTSISCGGGKATIGVSSDLYTVTLDNATITKNVDNAGILINSDRGVKLVVKGNNEIAYTSASAVSQKYSLMGIRTAWNGEFHIEGKDGGTLRFGFEKEVIGYSAYGFGLTNPSQYSLISMILRDVNVELDCTKGGAYLSECQIKTNNSSIRVSGGGLTSRNVKIEDSGSLCWVGKNPDGSDKELAENINDEKYAYKNGYRYYEITKPKYIEKLDFTFDIPNDGEEYPAEKVGIERVTKAPEGVKVVGVETVQFSKTIAGKAVANDLVTFGIIYEILPGYELASGAVATINGEEALKVLTGTGVRKVAFKEGVQIGNNPTIKITKDLPGTIEYTKGETISLSITATGKNMTYTWQIGVPSTGRKPTVYTDFGTNKNTATYTPSESDDGKYIRCKITNEDGNTYTTVATLKLVSAHTEVRYGDVNDDGVIDAFDYQMVKAYVLGTFKEAAADMVQRMDVNRDGVVDAFDYQMVKAHVLGTYVIE